MEDNAVEVLGCPEAFANPGYIPKHRRAYLADTSMGRDLSANEVVTCVRCKIGATPAAEELSADAVNPLRPSWPR
jgi:hypothetical protein